MVGVPGATHEGRAHGAWRGRRAAGAWRGRRAAGTWQGPRAGDTWRGQRGADIAGAPRLVPDKRGLDLWGSGPSARFGCWQQQGAHGGGVRGPGQDQDALAWGAGIEGGAVPAGDRRAGPGG